MRKHDYTVKELKVICRRLQVSVDQLNSAIDLMEEFKVESIRIDEHPASRVATFANQAMANSTGDE